MTKIPFKGFYEAEVTPYHEPNPKLGQPTAIMPVKYLRKAAARPQRYNMKRYRKRYRKKYYKKRYMKKGNKIKRLTMKIQRYLGETKDTTYRTQAITITKIDTVDSPWPILDTIQFPGLGTGNGARIGNDIFLKSIVIQLTFIQSAANCDLNPIRILIFKSTLKQVDIDCNTLWEPGTPVIQWTTARTNPGYGKKLMDFLVRPPIMDENEYNVSSSQVLNLSKTLKINKVLRIDPKDGNYLNKAFIYLYAIRGVDPIGTGCSITMLTKWYYKDN